MITLGLLGRFRFRFLVFLIFIVGGSTAEGNIFKIRYNQKYYLSPKFTNWIG
jgi:hypothetical protein